MIPQPGHGEPKTESDKPATPKKPVDDDEEDGDIATPKRDRDDEADAFERR